MAHWRVGHKGEALKWYKQAAQWLEKNSQALANNLQHAEELRRCRDEAAELLKIKDEPQRHKGTEKKQGK